jgi:hypothetical protein
MTQLSQRPPRTMPARSHQRHTVPPSATFSSPPQPSQQPRARAPAPLHPLHSLPISTHRTSLLDSVSTPPSSPRSSAAPRWTPARLSSGATGSPTTKPLPRRGGPRQRRPSQPRSQPQQRRQSPHVPISHPQPHRRRVVDSQGHGVVPPLRSHPPDCRRSLDCATSRTYCK